MRCYGCGKHMPHDFTPPVDGSLVCLDCLPPFDGEKRGLREQVNRRFVPRSLRGTVLTKRSSR